MFCLSTPLLMDGFCFPTAIEGLGLEEIIFVNVVSFSSWKRCCLLQSNSYDVCTLAEGAEKT